MKEQKWKKLFFLLLGINIVVVIILTAVINSSGKDENYSPTQINTNGHVPFKIQTDKEDLNQVINHYLDKEGLTGPIDYKVVLGDEVELYGTMPVFSQEIQMKLTFDPVALDNGDILLQQKSISVGQLQLPVSYVLKFIGDKYKLPDWVTIQPNKERIYVSLQKMKLKSDIHVKVDEFNLVNNDIRFTLLVPVK
ncbi:YpmS family protein [Bacillus sp. S/N-304-OC-R1]|uniref:YpmS family protein n=1 Tax=Bacillus sp. S/N-304-OC-R1 TaxID=2758034 RepID=UPI001C8E25ED|nr:YpmS family protein [Bacillus sp. S/N-304-OC-R1]MBY0122717.1 YpmS family protein [Bacillus sp. S/N-304-OC-R1]